MSHRGRISLSVLAIAGLAAIACATALGVGCSPGPDQPAAEQVAVAPSALGTVNVLTRSYDNQRTGANPNETILTQANVRAGLFGQIWHAPVDDAVFAQILDASSVPIGSTLVDVVYAAMMNNSIYAFNADNGADVWNKHVNFGQRPPRAKQATETATPVTSPATKANDGILGTPVIDASSLTI